MKPTQFAKGFKARPDTTSSEKRTALDRINAIDEIVNQEAGNDKQNTGRSSAYTEDQFHDDPAAQETEQFKAWRRNNKYVHCQEIQLPLKAIKPIPFKPTPFYPNTSSQ